MELDFFLMGYLKTHKSYCRTLQICFEMDGAVKYSNFFM